MGRKGNSRHIKRLSASNYLHIGRKTNAYVAKPNPGRHTLDTSIALTTVLKEKIDVAKNSREARSIIKAGKVQVNGKTVKDEKYPLGFGDVLSFTSGEYFEIGVARKGAINIAKREKGNATQLFKVTGKYIARGNKIMVRLHNGNILNGNNDVRVNDSVEVSSGKIKRVIKLEKGSKCLIVKGVHASETGTVTEIKKGSAVRDTTVEIEGAAGKTETLLDNIMVVGA